jgi:type 2 lantibiotic biosynthesis protein LanM
MAIETPTSDPFAPIIERFTASARRSFDASLSRLAGLDASEAALIREAADEALLFSARLKLNRVLLLELHASRRAGELAAEQDEDAFARFVERALRPEFDEHLDRRYPPLRRRLQRTLDQQRAALESLTERFVQDRALLAHFFGRAPGRLTALSLNRGDLHAGGHTVACLSLEGGEVMYKPRSLRIDAVLETFLASVFGEASDRIRVPRVIDRGDYGWVAFVVHRYCRDEEELRAFYLRLGHWLAVLRLLGGTDIHHENLIAEGAVPVVIDVESLFAVIPKHAPSGYGHAYDAAQALISNSVVRTGIVPYRGSGSGFEGADMSAAGALPDQQPKVQMPIIDGAGTTGARLKMVEADIGRAQNHPSPQPKVDAYWDQISEGFLAASETLRRLDARGELEPMLGRFEGCAIRDIRLPTQIYVEIGRMLWHPASLHDEAKAIERARQLFVSNAKVSPIASSTPQEIDAEIQALLHGDIPVFVAPLARARIDATLAGWRAMRIDLEELTIRSALVAIELNARGHLSDDSADLRLCRARNPHAAQLETRRRKLAVSLFERLLKLAVPGDDGSLTWITPETTSRGWLIQPLQGDLYFGLAGVTVALAGYRHEIGCGRADAVTDADAALEGALRALLAFEATDQSRELGAFSGYGAQIWTWLTLRDLLQRPDFVERALRAAEALEREGFDRDTRFDLIDGSAGVIVPLIGLAEASGDERWLALAARAARRLEDTAVVDARGARWAGAFEEPVGGFSHGAVGIGWALARLALTRAGEEKDRARWSALADGAFSFQDSLFDATRSNWIDQRYKDLEAVHDTWCNGSVGIGLAAADLYARTRDPKRLHMMRRAVAASRGKWGISHTLCHGDFSLWELQMRAAALDPEMNADNLVESSAHIVSSIEEHRGIVSGRTRSAFTPGLMTGLAGAIHGLNRMHPDCTLPSPLLLERVRAAA